MESPGVSALVLTLNEEINLPGCLNSLAWCDDIVVLDSYSTDGTIDRARSAGARVFQRKFDDYASQRSFGLNKIQYKHPWLLMVDADERVPAELAKEIASVVQRGTADVCLFRVRRKDFFMGRWIKHSSGYPTWFGRLVRIGAVRVQRAVNEEYVTDGKVGYLRGHLHHYPFSKGFGAWFEKHNRYSTMEAELLRNDKSKKPQFSSLLNRDPTIRRRELKALIYRLPCRPVVIFCALYFFKGGFLDGRPGLTYCLLRSLYEFMIDCKIKELDIKERGGTL